MNDAIYELQEEDSYALFFTNTNWYLFMRLHQILADRLHAIKVECDRLSAEHARAKEEKTESTAIALRLKTPSKLCGYVSFALHNRMLILIEIWFQLTSRRLQDFACNPSVELILSLGFPVCLFLQLHPLFSYHPIPC